MLEIIHKSRGLIEYCSLTLQSKDSRIAFVAYISNPDRSKKGQFFKITTAYSNAITNNVFWIIHID